MGKSVRAFGRLVRNTLIMWCCFSSFWTEVSVANSSTEASQIRGRAQHANEESNKSLTLRIFQPDEAKTPKLKTGFLSL